MREGFMAECAGFMSRVGVFLSGVEAAMKATGGVRVEPGLGGYSLEDEDFSFGFDVKRDGEALFWVGFYADPIDAFGAYDCPVWIQFYDEEGAWQTAGDLFRDEEINSDMLMVGIRWKLPAGAAADEVFEEGQKLAGRLAGLL
ncbi:MAG: hypothetical protein WC889_17630 [Myxococcota bacterium]|jgi:hypothetical protein